MENHVGRFEIAATDLKSLRRFYAQLFEWNVTDDDPRYSIVRPPDGVPGMILKAQAGVPTYVTVYVEVDDLDAYLKKAESLGGTVYLPPTDSPVPGERRFAIFGDPEDNLIGIRERAR